MDVFKIYIDGLKEGKEIFEYIPYEIQVFDEPHKALFKAKYIKDKKLKMLEYRRILGQQTADLGNKPPRENISFPNDCFDTYKEFTDYLSENRLFYNIWGETANKRRFEIEVYIEDIINLVNEFTDETQQINYLIDEMFKYHRDILDEPKADLAFRHEINALIFKCLQIKINEINTTPIMDIGVQVANAQNRYLQWNAQKNIIGTLFGLMYKSGAIKGSKADLARAICAMFPNLSENTLMDNINLKIDEAESKTKYDTETEKMTADFITYLKNSTPKAEK